MKINKIIFIVLTLIATVSISMANPSSKEIPSEKDKIHLEVALILWRGETQAEKGLRDELKKLGYKINYTIFDAANKRYEFPTVLRKIEFEQFDYVYTFGTTATQMTKRLLKNKVPHIFNIVTSPVKAKIVEKMDSTGGNISGISNKIPLQMQIEIAKKMIQFKKLATFFNPREENSTIALEKLIQLGKKLDFEVISLRSPTKKMLKENLQKLIDKTIETDAVYLPSDSFLISNAKLIGTKIKKAKLLSFGAIKDYISAGIMIGTVPDYYSLGKEAAYILHKHQNGKKLEDISVQMPKEPTILLNKTTFDLLNIKISEELINKAIIIK